MYYGKSFVHAGARPVLCLAYDQDIILVPHIFYTRYIEGLTMPVAFGFINEIHPSAEGLRIVLTNQTPAHITLTHHSMSITMSKRVRFRDGSIASTTTIAMAYSDCDSWYQSQDYRNFLRDRRRTAKALREAHGDASCLDASRYCLRGLEGSLSGNDDHRLLSYGRERRSQQTSIIRMVLEAQDEQRQMGIQNHDTIRALYMVLSKVARDRATEVAALDAAAVASIVDDEHVNAMNNNEPAAMGFQRQRQSRCLTLPSIGHPLGHDDAAPKFNNARPLRSVRPRDGRSESPARKKCKEDQQVLLFV